MQNKYARAVPHVSMHVCVRKVVPLHKLLTSHDTVVILIRHVKHLLPLFMTRYSLHRNEQGDCTAADVGARCVYLCNTACRSSNVR